MVTADLSASTPRSAVELIRAASLDLRELPGWEGSHTGEVQVVLAIDGRALVFESSPGCPHEVVPNPASSLTWHKIPAGQRVRVVLVRVAAKATDSAPRLPEARHRDIDWDDLLTGHGSSTLTSSSELDDAERQSLSELLTALRQRSPRDEPICSLATFRATWPEAPLSAISMAYGSLVSFLRSEAPQFVEDTIIGRAVRDARAAFLAATGLLPSDRATAMLLAHGDLGLVTPREAASYAGMYEQVPLPISTTTQPSDDEDNVPEVVGSSLAAEPVEPEPPSPHVREEILARHCANVREAADLLRLPTTELQEIKSQWRSLFAFLRELRERQECR